MIVALDLPAGAHRQGTDYQSKGRWRDVHLVRWQQGAMKPVKGWGTGFSTGFDGLVTTASTQIRTVGAMAWTDNSGAYRCIWGTNLYAGVVASDGTTTELTPAGLTTGSTSWHWGAFGEIPVGCGDRDGRLWEWDLDTGNNLTQITNSPTGCTGLLVTDERFIFALGDGGDPRSIRWCDREDRTTWTPAQTNQAGGYDLDTNGEIRFGLQMRGQVLIVTSTDAWIGRYIGYPEVYEFHRIGSGGAVGNNAGVSIGDRAFWLGDNGFWQCAGGYLSPLPCDVLDYFRSDIDTTHNPSARAEITTWHNSEHHEVWWLYRSTSALQGANNTDSYIAYNYLEDTWHYGRQPCACIVDKVPFEFPLGFRSRSLIVINEPFTSDTGVWAMGGTNWQISGGTLNMSTPATGHSASRQSVSVTQAQEYVVRFTIAGRTAGGVIAFFGENLGTFDTNATHTALAATEFASQPFLFTSSGLFDGTIDDLLVRQPVIVNFGSGWVYDGTAPYAETGPLELGVGERRAHVMRVYPDEQDAGELLLTFKHREYPTGTETSEAAVTAANPTDVRFSGREFRLRVEPVVTNGVAADWRSGIHRLEVKAGGRR